jgi:hypothetical protein
MADVYSFGALLAFLFTAKHPGVDGPVAQLPSDVKVCGCGCCHLCGYRGCPASGVGHPWSLLCGPLWLPGTLAAAVDLKHGVRVHEHCSSRPTAVQSPARHVVQCHFPRVGLPPARVAPPNLPPPPLFPPPSPLPPPPPPFPHPFPRVAPVATSQWRALLLGGSGKFISCHLPFLCLCVRSCRPP